MYPNKANNAVNAYSQTGVNSGAYASPHRLIQMLIDGALDKISAAKGFMQRGQIAEKGSYISWAISIIAGLRTSLDPQKGGEIAVNLESLYDYMERKLVLANSRNDEEMLDEVIKLLREVKVAWDGIPDQVKNPGPGSPAKTSVASEA